MSSNFLIETTEIIPYVNYFISNCDIGGSFTYLMPVTPPEEQEGVLTKIFQNGSTAKVIDFFLDRRDLDYSIAEVSDKAQISIQTVSKEIGSLEKIGFLKIQRTIGKTAMYRWNSDVRELRLLQQFALQISQIPSFQNLPEKIQRQEIIENAINS